jgi:hypothetical protein
LYTGGYIYTAGKRKKNPWVRYLKVFRRYMNKTYSFPDRRKIAKEIYNELKKSGQLEMLVKHHKLPPEIRAKLDEMLAIKPKTGLELALSSKKTAMEFPEVFSQMEFPESKPSVTVIPPTSPTPIPMPEPEPKVKISEISPKEEEAFKRIAQENLAETVEKTIKNLPKDLPEDSKIAILVRNIQDKQKELVGQGNLMATDAGVVLDSLADAAIKEPADTKNIIIEATSILTGKPAEYVKTIINLKEKTIKAISSIKEVAEEQPLTLTSSESVPFEEVKVEELADEEEEKKSQKKGQGLRRARGVRRRMY